jgi:Flp pilus assembly protein TadB
MVPQKKPSTTAKDTDNNRWTVETLLEYLKTLIESNDTRYGQRFEAQQVATNAAFVAQTTAMTTAFAAQKVAIDAAFAAQKEAVNAALAAADRAVSKAEIASEKRFDNVNEFRGTLADQQRTLMPRAEAELLFKTLSDKIDILTQESKGNSGQRIGSHETAGNFFAVGAIIVAIVATLVTSLIAIVLHFIK